jgi:protein TonB
MDISQKHFVIPIGIIISLFSTTVLFVALPLLTQFQAGQKERKRTEAILISTRRPPPPPAADRDKKIERSVKQKVQQTKKTTQTARPKIDLPNVGLLGGTNLAGGIKIAGLTKQEFRISSSLFATAFELTEVDQPPRVLRSVPPQYPFSAKRNNIEGRVVLRFVVDADGNAQEPEVAEAEPPGIFDEAALRAVLRYKFKPAVKDGENVDCIVKLPISFTIR